MSLGLHITLDYYYGQAPAGVRQIWLICNVYNRLTNVVTGLTDMQSSDMVKYCRVPVRWGLRRTTLGPGSDETRIRDPLVH